MKPIKWKVGDYGRQCDADGTVFATFKVLVLDKKWNGGLLSTVLVRHSNAAKPAKMAGWNLFKPRRTDQPYQERVCVLIGIMVLGQ